MIRLVIADDHPLLREGIKRIVEHEPDMRMVAEAADGHQALERCRELTPDVLLLDVSMPGPGFAQVLERLQKESPGVRVLVLSVHPSEHYAVRAIRAGAMGYLTKEHSPEELIRAVRRIQSGRRYVTAEVAESLAMEIGNRGDSSPHARLSTREYQIFCLLGQGLRVVEVAERLALSPKTVSTYRTRILEKTGFHSNQEIIRYVLENRLEE